MMLNIYDREKVIEMLKYEETIRYSKEIQEIYTQQYKMGLNLPIEKEIQKHVLTHFGFDEACLEEYWKIPKLYWLDEEVKNSIFYMKLNIFTYGDLKVNDDMIDVELMEYATGNNVRLSDFSNDKPLVILAGSMT